jgi:hypothetical protein
LTIKATLFSAIVTVFTIEFSKRLEVDRQESTANILFVIHQQLDSIARKNITTLPPLIPNPASTFEPQRSTVMVHCFLVTSLIHSLSTAALCILCLQWLREHQRQPSGLGSPKEMFPLRAHRNRLMDIWCMSILVGTLPAFLVISLFCFLVALLTMYVSKPTPSGIYFAALIGIVLAGGIFLAMLPTISRKCLLRSPQSWFMYQCLRALGLVILSIYPANAVASLVAPLVDVLGMDRVWSSLQKCPYKIVTPFQHFILNLDDWGHLDRKELESSRDPGFQWFGTTFAHDREAIQAMVGCLEKTIADSQAKPPHNASQREVQVLARQMAALEGRQLEEPLAHARGGIAVQWPLELARDVAVATCIDYATRVQESLIPLFLKRRMELHVKIQHATSGTPKPISACLSRLVEDCNAAFGNYRERYPDLEMELQRENSGIR